MPKHHTDDDRWAAVIARDRAADGTFVYAVRTTGVYCRPSCPARRPRRSNVQFHEAPAEAKRLGFRPCRRCRPDSPGPARETLERVAEACRVLESAGDLPRLSVLASGAGLSPHHFHRLFRATIGLTPRAYFLAHRARRVHAALKRRGTTVTEAIFDAGFNSGGRFYSHAGDLLGMSPTRYRNGGAGEEIHFAVAPCSLGLVLVARTAKGVCSIQIGDTEDGLVRELTARFPSAKLIGDDAPLAGTIAAVVRFVETPARGLDLPLDIRGTAFQQRVWEALRRIPPGTTVTYAELARQLGVPRSARAVGQACAANRVALAIPCHRVIGTGGSLAGYRWGVERKRALLDRERNAARPAPDRHAHLKVGRGSSSTTRVDR